MVFKNETSLLCIMKYIIWSLLLLTRFQSEAQLRLLSYNLLNFPTSNLAGRVDTLANIIDYTRPHLLMIQELENAEGLEQITDMMNDLGYGDFTHPDFIPQQSPGSPSNQLQQSIVYDAEVLRLKSSSVVLTDYRDINEFVLYLNDPQLPNGSDTTFLYVYVTHLKSSTGSDNELARLSMVNYLISHFEELPPNSNVIFAGDFNLYTNTEPAYTAITSEDNAIVLKDIFASYGDWPGATFPHKEILTQCTRTSVIFNDGAGGGVDDRFDFILMSESLLETDNGLYYVEGSYKSIGNTGNCYNANITDCDIANPVPTDVLQSMYYMSDHIPQYCELFSDIIDNHGEINTVQPGFFFPYGNIAQENLCFGLQGYNAPSGVITVYDVQGKEIHSQILDDSNLQFLPSQKWQDGMYIISLMTSGHVKFNDKFLIQR